MNGTIHLAMAGLCLVSSGDAFAGGPPPIAVPAEVVGHPDPLSLLQDDDPALAANKRLVFDMWRSIVNAGHVELADAMLREDYIQHSPVLPTGRAAFKAVFSAVPRRSVPEFVEPPLVAILAERDLVVMALREEMPEPERGENYTTTHFNLFRVESGRLAEHWHSVQAAPGPQLPSAVEGGPQPVTGLSGAARLALLDAGSPELAANKRLMFDAWQSAKGVRENFAASYVTHDPRPGPTLQPLPPADASLVALVAQGDLVVLATRLEHPHPHRQGDIYTTTWFDMARIVDGRIVEHWNGAIKPGTPPAQYGG